MGVRVAVPADARVFLGRLTRLDPGAVVRLRPGAPGRTGLWARLPWGVLVTREAAIAVPGDLTVGAAALLATASQEGSPLPDPAGGGQPSWEALPPRRDAEWRWPLPPSAGTVVEEIPAHRLRQVAAAAAGTLREVTQTGLAGRPVGARVLREALLDHVAIVVETGAGRLEVSQRAVQAVVRMGFLGAGAGGEVGEAPGESPGEAAGDARGEAPVRVRTAARWIGIAARYGTAWLPPAGPLTVRPR